MLATSELLASTGRAELGVERAFRAARGLRSGRAQVGSCGRSRTIVVRSGASHCSERCREYWTYRHGRSAIREEGAMQAIAVRDRDAGPAGLSLTELPYPQAAENDVIVRVHAAGFTPGELAWAGTWTDRGGRDRTPSVPGHEVSGVVAELGYGTTGLTVGQRVFGRRLDAQRHPGGVRGGGGAQPCAAASGRRPYRRRRCSDLRTDGMAGAVRPRPPPRRADGADPWRRGRRRLDRCAACPSGRLPGDRNRPGR